MPQKCVGGHGSALNPAGAAYIALTLLVQIQGGRKQREMKRRRGKGMGEEGRSRKEKM